MRTIFKIRLSYFFLLTALTCVFTGMFREFSFFMSLILIHECGHALMAKILRWKVKEIVIYPFGGVTIFEEKVNRSMKEEFMILVSGPLTQIAYYFLISKVLSVPFLFHFYHEILLLFNLIPIYPLDGGKLFSLFYQTCFPFLTSHKVLIFSSYFFCFLFLLYFSFIHFSLILLFYFCLLLFKILEEKRKENFLFHKFLLERSLYSFSFPDTKKIEGEHFERMYRDYSHIFHIHQKWIKEEELFKNKLIL